MPTLDQLSPADLRAIEPNELARRAHGGCADSYTELSRRYRPRLLLLLERRLGHRLADAEDVAQEALARAFRRLDQFDDRYQFSTWLYTIAVRLACDHAKSDRRRRERVALDGSVEAAVDFAAERAFEHAEQVDNIWRVARQALSDEQYTAMWLRYGEDLSPVEISRVMGRNRIAVRVMLHRARTTLAARLTSRESHLPTR